MIVSRLTGDPEPTSPAGKLWRTEDNRPVKEFIRNFKSPSISPLIDATPLCNFVDWLAEQGKQKWDICFVSPKKDEYGHIHILGQQINLQKRNIQKDEKFIFVNADKRRLGYAALEAIGLPVDRINEAKKEYLKAKPGASIVGSIYRKVRKDFNPLLLVYILHGEEVNVEVTTEIKDGQKRLRRVAHTIGKALDNIVAYSISFPGEAGSRYPEKPVSYMVNKVYQQLHDDGVVDDDNEEEVNELD